MRISSRAVAVALCLAAGGPAIASNSGGGLPDPEHFMTEVRKRLQEDEERQRAFVFLETRREQKLDSSGRPTEQSVKIFESHPGLPGERRWRRLIEEDGAPVPQAELDRQDQERRAHVEAATNGSPGEDAGPRGRNEERVEDAFRVFRFEMIGRERRDGHDTIVFSLTPRPDAKPQTREGKVMRYFHGRAWVSEAEHELVRLEAEAVNDVSIGLGLLGRVHKGSRFSFERRKIDGDTWLPVRSDYTASARVLLVRRIHMAGTTEYSQYRRVSSEAALRVP